METQSADSGSRTLKTLTVVLFIFAGVVNLLLAKWLDAAFYLLGGFVFLKVNDMKRWRPKAVGYLVVLTLLALAVAMFVELIIELKAGGRH